MNDLFYSLNIAMSTSLVNVFPIVYMNIWSQTCIILDTKNIYYINRKEINYKMKWTIL